MKTIALKFAGPLQSWGTDSHFETRRTDRYPSKSAVIGLIAASFGFRRDDDAQITRLNELDFAVRIDQQGKLLRDYHTAVKNKPDGSFERTYVTDRYYLLDAVFVVVIGHEDEAFMSRIEDALLHPYFQPYMGRRSLPLPADFIVSVTNATVIDSIKEIPWQAGQWYQKKYNLNQRLDIYADKDLIASNMKNTRQDRVISFSPQERKFSFRSEAHLQISLPEFKLETEHDVFSSVRD